MPSFIQSWLENEMYKHPLVLILAITAASLTSGVILNPFVMAGDFQKFQTAAEVRLGTLEIAVCTVQNTIEQTSIEAQMRDVSTEIFQLERIAAAHESTPRDIDRLDNLRNEKAALETRLREYLDRAECMPDPSGAGQH